MSSTVVTSNNKNAASINTISTTAKKAVSSNGDNKTFYSTNTTNNITKLPTIQRNIKESISALKNILNDNNDIEKNNCVTIRYLDGIEKVYRIIRLHYIHFSEFNIILTRKI